MQHKAKYSLLRPSSPVPWPHSLSSGPAQVVPALFPSSSYPTRPQMGSPKVHGYAQAMPCSTAVHGSLVPSLRLRTQVPAGTGLGTQNIPPKHSRDWWGLWGLGTHSPLLPRPPSPVPCGATATTVPGREPPPVQGAGCLLRPQLCDIPEGD